MTKKPEVKFRWQDDGDDNNSYHYLLVYWHRRKFHKISMARLLLYAHGELESPFYHGDEREAHHVDENPWFDSIDNLEARNKADHNRITHSA